MTDLRFLDFLFLLAFIGFYFVLKKELGGYFKQKGKNLAQKEDIEELTKKVEAVKQEFVDKTAMLRAKLDVLSQLQIDHTSREREAIIEYHQKVSAWINMLTDTHEGGVDHYDNEQIYIRMRDLDNTYQKMLNAESLLGLFVEDQDLTSTIQELKISILKSDLPKLAKTSLIKHKGINNQILSWEEGSSPEKHERIQALLDERTALVTQYVTDMIEGYKKFSELVGLYESKTREYLKQLST